MGSAKSVSVRNQQQDSYDQVPSLREIHYAQKASQEYTLNTKFISTLSEISTSSLRSLCILEEVDQIILNTKKLINENFIEQEKEEKNEIVIQPPLKGILKKQSSNSFIDMNHHKERHVQFSLIKKDRNQLSRLYSQNTYVHLQKNKKQIKQL